MEVYKFSIHSDNIKLSTMFAEKKAFKIKKELFISSSKTKNIKEDYEYIR